MIPPSGPWTYSIYGLRIQSDVAIPGWPEQAPGAPDIRFLRRPLQVPRSPGPLYSGHGEVTEEGMTLVVRGVAAYRATKGTDVIVDPEAGASDADVLLYLTGAVLGVTLHLRGLYPLHASCVTWGGTGDAIAFAGPSGAGKSTLAAALAMRGGVVVADDVAVVHCDEHEAIVWPGARRLRLDLDSLGALDAPGVTPGRLEQAGGNRGKLHLPLTGEIPPPVTLKRVYILQHGDGAPRVEPLSGLEQVTALVEETYLFGYASGLGLGGQCFRLAAEVARRAHVARLVRPAGFDHMPSTLDTILRDAGYWEEGNTRD